MDVTRLRHDLRAARRASETVHDPLSSRRLRAYIDELETQLDRTDHRIAPPPRDEI